LAESEIQGIAEVVFIRGTAVEDDGEGLFGMDTGSGSIEG